MQAGGRYRGLIIRKEKKGHGSQKLIPGPGRLCAAGGAGGRIHSVSSGSSIMRGLEIAEAAGLRAGGVCLVRFAWHGGYARMQARGYQMEHVFDIHEHLVPRVDPDCPRYPYNPSAIAPPFAWADEAAPEGIHAAAYAREVVAAALRQAPVRRPPRQFERPYDGAGGVWVSVRARANLHQRHARDGSWVFPSEAPRDTGTQLVWAAVRVARALGRAELLDASAIAVTFFGALEEVTVGQLDNDRYGIVVRSRERVERLGGALPRMPGMTREWAQFSSTRAPRTASSCRSSPTRSLATPSTRRSSPTSRGSRAACRASARRPGATSRRGPGGSRRACSRSRARRSRARRSPARRSTTRSPARPTRSSLSIFAGGRIAGCVGAKVVQLEADLRRLTAQALADARFGGAAGRAGASQLGVTVSFLTPTPWPTAPAGPRTSRPGSATASRR